MSKDKKLASLLAEIEQEIARNSLFVGESRQFIENLLEEKLYEQAQEVITAAQNKQGLADASDLWDCLIGAVTTAIEKQAPDFQGAASLEYEQNLKQLVAEANTGWVFIAPVKVECNRFPVDVLSTKQNQRTIIRGEGSTLQPALATSLQSFKVSSVPRNLVESCGGTPLFLTKVTGNKEIALSQGRSSLKIAVDALRFSTAEISSFLPNAVNPLEAFGLSQEMFLLDLSGQKLERFTSRRQFQIGSLFSLENAKTRSEYDKVARLLEMCPGNPSSKKQKDLIWRIARSVRTFSRAREQHNLDLQFLLLLVGLEAILNQKEAPIAEALADYGALLTETDIARRTKLAEDLKAAYNLRSRFVHDGIIPSETNGEEGLRQIAKMVFSCWKKIVLKLLEMNTDDIQKLSSDDFFKKLQQLKYGATWPQVFSK